MSECVVRIDMPENCECCPMVFTADVPGYHWCAALEQEVEQGLSRPKECPIICQLPEGHGRLVDGDMPISEIEKYITIWDCNCSEYGNQTVMAVDDLGYLPIIVPADAERSD